MRVHRLSQPTPMSLEVLLTESIIIAFAIMTISNKRISSCQVCLRKSTKYVVNLINVFVKTISTITFIDLLFFLMYIFYP